MDTNFIKRKQKDFPTSISIYLPYLTFLKYFGIFPYSIESVSIPLPTSHDQQTSSDESSSFKSIKSVSYYQNGKFLWLHRFMIGVFLLNTGFEVFQLIRNLNKQNEVWTKNTSIAISLSWVFYSFSGISASFIFIFKKQQFCTFLQKWNQIEKDILYSKLHMHIMI